MIKRCLLLALLLPLAGCAQMAGLTEAYDGLTEYFTGKDNAEPPMELQPIKEEIHPQIVWKDSVGDGYDERSLNLIPALDDNRLYVASHDGRVEARDKNTGKVIWAVDTDLPFSGGIGIGPGHLLIGTDNAELVALKDSNGSVQWTSSVPSEVLSIPKEQNGIVVVRCTDGHIQALNADNGSLRWHYERAVPNLSLRVLGSPALADGLVVDGYASGKLVALKLEDGQVQWETVVAYPRGRSEIERLVDLGGEPAVRGDTLYLVGFKGGLAAVTLSSGEVQWRIDTVSGYSGPVATRRSLFLTDDDGDVWRFETNVGGDMWRQGDLHQRRVSAPVVFRDYVVVGDFEGYLHFLSQDDGHFVGRIQISKEPIVTTLIADETQIYAYDKSGNIAAVGLH